jgi:hypothetical protein
MRVRRPLTVLAVITTAGLLGSPASAAPGDAGNRDWGKVASNTAQLDTSHATADDGSDANGGAMGQHSRSTEAANINGGFAGQDTDGDGDGGNAFGIEFNTDGGRQGVGNVSSGPPHNTDPGDGGNGVHAINNANAAGTLDPVTGDLTESAGGTAPDSSDELLEGTSGE